ncbi:MAG TPA: zinc-dependent metalloprotease family protein [Phycisphaerales bacterium]|nr:zinc-dependent metalloprotease family protein [Phycisphaerales bacterium]
MMRNGVCGLIALLGLAAPAVGQVQPVNGELRQAIAAKLELSDFTVQRLALPADNVGFTTEVKLGDVEYGLWVEPASFRSAGVTATTVGADGLPKPMALPAPLTVRGELDGVDDARVAGSRAGGGLNLAIFIPGAQEPEIWNVQPLTDVQPGADPTLHVVYRDDDVALQQAWACGVQDAGVHDHAEAHEDHGGGGRAFLVCELAVEVDWEYYQLLGSNEATVIADVDTVIARIAAVYEGECNVTFTIPHYNIWTNSGDPYTSSDPGARLDQFRNWWNGNKGDVARDLAHMFTGVNLNGSVIGIAYLSVVCSGNQGYGLVQSKYTNAINARGALSAHEIGHNFSAGHCDGNGDCHIMCSGLGGCDGLGNPAFFGGPSATKITNYAANRSCLTQGGGLTYPFFEEWADTTIDSDTWPANSGGVVNSDASAEPSAPYSLNLDGSDSIESGSLDLTGVLENPYFSFYTQHTGVENGKSIVAEYRDINGDWQAFDTIVSDGANQSTFQFHVYPIEVFAWGTDFAVRFRALGADGGDDWYIDNIAVSPFPGNPLPFYEPFADSSFDTGTAWDAISGAQVSTGADNEPSSPYSMNLDGTDSATTFNFLMAAAPFPTYLSFFTQHKGVENGKTLVVEYVNDFGGWTEFMTITSDGANQGQFSFHQSSLMIDAFHDGFAIRFRAAGADSTDDWYVDDIRLGDEFTPPDDCVADFNDDGNVNTQDVLAFLNAWNAGDASADINGDGTVNTQDVLAFLNLWNVGC